MILSKEQEFSDAQTVTATAASTNLIDLGATGTVVGGAAALVRDIGKGEKIPIVVEVTAASGTSPTLDVAVQMDTTSAFSSATTVQTAAQVTAAGRVALWVLPEQITERYLRLNYTVGGTSPSFTIDSYIPYGDQEGLLGGVGE